MLRQAVCVLGLSAALGAAACSGSSAGSKSTPAGRSTGVTTGTTSSAVTPGTSENGHDPIFWRTADNFQSIQAGQPYLAVFRITNGFAEPTLTVTATCMTCSRPSDRQPLTFQGQISQPVGADLPGSYYPMNIALPNPGRWELVVNAGVATTKLLVDVHTGQSSG
jgi:hypothetical protein